MAADAIDKIYVADDHGPIVFNGDPETVYLSRHGKFPAE